MNCQSWTQSAQLARSHAAALLLAVRRRLGKIALASLLARRPRAVAARRFPGGSVAPVNPLAPKPPHYPAKATAIIHLFMGGAPSHLDLFDYKPKLAQFEGKPIPPEVIGGQRYAFIRPDAAALGPRFKFAKHGQCGAEISEVMPHLAKVVDDICLVRSLPHRSVQPRARADFFQHRVFAAGPPQHRLVGHVRAGRRNRDLPAFVVMSTGTGISGGAANWSSGFLPTVYSGVRFAIRAIRFSTSAARPASTPESSDKRSTC